MVSVPLAHAAIFRELVGRLGGAEAAAAVCQASGHTTTTSTISRMASGQIAVSVDALIVVEDALGEFPFTRLAAGRLDDPPPFRHRREVSLPQLIGDLAVQGGGATAALIDAINPKGPGGATLTPAERAATAARLRTLIDCASRAVAMVEAGE
ncbi:hypothetical protein ACXN5S_19335 [Pseudoroseicyclus sp. H15]